MFEDFEDFEPIYFLNFSKELYDNINSFDSNKSTIKRVIYGRIYYATFLNVREWLKENSNYNSTRGDHTQIIKFIRNNGPFNDIKNHKIADDIHRLKILRQQVDYNITLPEDGTPESIRWISDNIEDSFQLAYSIIDSFNEL